MSRERVKPYMIVKPEGARFLNELEQTLNDNGLQIITVFSAPNWGNLARKLYEPQLLSSDLAFNVGFETHLWLVQYLFGNQALILILDIKDIKGSIDTQVQFVKDVRNYFRTKLAETNDNTFIIAVNLDRLPGEAYIGTGVTGQLGVLNSNSPFSPLAETNFEGRWDNHFFKYIHAPDDVNALIYEWAVLKELEVLSTKNKISRKEWEILKFIRSLVPPSKYPKMQKPKQ